MKSILAKIEKSFPQKRGWTYQKDSLGHGNNQIYFLQQKGINKWVFKARPINSEGPSLETEYENLNWLQDKIKVPKVSWYAVDNHWEFLFMEYLSGTPSCFFNPKAEIGKRLGMALKKIHHIPFTSYWNQENKSAKLLSSLLEKKALNLANIVHLIPMEWDLVFSHGDYCLPNILLGEEGHTGIIDLGEAGIHDRYHDLYWAIWSFKHNQLEDQIPAFLEAYGIQELDQNKLLLMKHLN